MPCTPPPGELVLGCGIQVGHGQVELLMRRAGLHGLPGRKRWRHAKPDTYATDLVKRDFARSRANALWATDITEHPTREGKVYCAAVLDTYSRCVVGWSIDASPTAALVTNALSMAISSRGEVTGTIIHSDQGVQGGFNWSSQHLDDGGVQGWRQVTGLGRPVRCLRGCVVSGVRTGRCGHRCVRRAGRIHRGRCSDSSGG